MMNRRTFSKLWLCTGGIAIATLPMQANATPTVYTDTQGDAVAAASVNAARDIYSASIDDDGTNLYITLNLNPTANVPLPFDFNYGIG